jgi:hypothetical protein
VRPASQSLLLRLLPVALACFAGSATASAQGWTDLPNTSLTSVCPPNNFGTASGMGAYNFSANCHNVVDANSDCDVDLMRVRLVCFGGGHEAYWGNEVYSVDLVTLSATAATSCGPNGCHSNTTAPAITRLTDPSINPLTCSNVNPTSGEMTAAPNADGAPLSRHTYQAFRYLPRTDMFFAWGGPNQCGSWAQGDGLFYYFNPSTNKWSVPTQTYTNTTPPNQFDFCVLDTTYAGPGDKMWCWASYQYLVRVNFTATTVTFTSVATATIQEQPDLVFDPDRKLVWSFGCNGFNAGCTPGTGKIMKTDIGGGTYAVTDVTASTTGCTDVYQYWYPSGTWDSALHRIVLYVPRTATGTNVSTNEVFIFDPATLTCVRSPLTGGPGASGALLIDQEQGVWDRFTYVQPLNEYVALVNPTTDVYSFRWTANPVNGIGSTTLTCVDLDGDGYGTGPGCLGPDADDFDSSVWTATQFLSKWSTIPLGLNHLGYNPANIWYVSATGNDSTGTANNAALPFATCCGSGHANPAAGDAVLFRGGNYTFFAAVPTGTAGNPVILMSYPGEQATFNTMNPSGFYMLGKSYIVIDGILFHANGGNACVNPDSTTHMEFRHIDASGCVWGLEGAGDSSPYQALNDLTIDSSVFHANNGSGTGQHGIYLAAHGSAVNTDLFVRRSLLYGNDENGSHVNGQNTNSIFEQLITYNNGLTGLDFENGLTNSVVRNWECLNDGTYCLNVSTYNGNEGTNTCGSGGTSPCVCNSTQGAICAFNQTGNLFSNITYYRSNLAPILGCNSGMDNACRPFAIVGHQGGGNCTTSRCQSSLNGSNTFQNIVGTTNNSGYPPFNFTDSPSITNDIASSTFTDIDTWTTNPSYTTVVGGNTLYGTPVTYTPSALEMLATVTNFTDTNPFFVSASPTYWNSLTSFNLQLQSSSPAIGAGSPIGSAIFDLVGNPLTYPPSLGAYQTASVSSSTSPTPPSISITSPVSGSTASGSITISANASSSLGIASVQFTLDGANLGAPINSVPYSLSWNTIGVANGTHTLAAIATDTSGATATSAGVAVTVANAVTPAPTISLTSPSGGAILSGTVTLKANASSSLAIASVQFKVDGVNLGPAASVSPYPITWATTGTTNGQHAISAVAVDTQGNTGTATPIVVTVSNSTSSPPTQGLTAYWNFDEDSGSVAHDSSSNGYNGTVNGATWVAGKINYALNFNGTTTDVVTGNIPLSNTFSIAAWVNPSVTTEAQYARIAENEYNKGFYVGTDTSGTKYKFIVNDGSGSTGSCGASFGCAQGGTVTTGWHLVTGTFDGSNGTLYVDNSLVASDTFTAPGNTTFPLYIGRYYQANSNGWTGSLDEVRLYNRPLSGGEVSAIYNYTGANSAFPVVSVTAPAVNATVSNTVVISATANGASPIAGVQFTLDGTNFGAVATTAPYSLSWDTTTAGNGTHSLAAVANDSLGNSTTSGLVVVTVGNSAGATNSSCDLNGAGVVSSADVQIAINQAIGIAPCTNASLQQNGQCNVIDVQRVVNAALGGACRVGP